LAALLLSCAAWADGPSDALLDARVEAVSRELRCVVCQNQSIADSNAPLAQDLKQRVRALLAEGQTEAQVRDHLVARYGDQLLYRPPLRPDTALLWTAPVLLTAFGIGLLAWQRRRASQLDPAELEPDTDEATPTP
jgi:cytochrome c-type biogenesis protein CcmH